MLPKLSKAPRSMPSSLWLATPGPHKSPMDLFSRKSKPPDLNLIKKATQKQNLMNKYSQNNDFQKKHKTTRQTNPTNLANPTRPTRPNRHQTTKTPDANHKSGGMCEAMHNQTADLHEKRVSSHPVQSLDHHRCVNGLVMQHVQLQVANASTFDKAGNVRWYQSDLIPWLRTTILLESISVLTYAAPQVDAHTAQSHRQEHHLDL